MALKIRLFKAAVIAALAHGSEAWWLTEAAVVRVRGWAARCLARVTGREVREECLGPTVDVVGNLRVRRLRWLGHLLRHNDASLLKRVVLMEHTQQLGGGTEQSRRRTAGGCTSSQLCGGSAGDCRRQRSMGRVGTYAEEVGAWAAMAGSSSEALGQGT